MGSTDNTSWAAMRLNQLESIHPVKVIIYKYISTCVKKANGLWIPGTAFIPSHDLADPGHRISRHKVSWQVTCDHVRDRTELHPLKNLYFSGRLPTDLWTWQNISSLQLYKRLATFTSTSLWGWRRLLRRMQVTKTEDFPPVVWQTKIRLNPIKGRFISHLSLWVGNVWIIFFLTYFSAIQNIHKQN